MPNASLTYQFYLIHKAAAAATVVALMNMTSFIGPTLKDRSLLKTQHYIGGRWEEPQGRDEFHVIDPCTEEPWISLRSSSTSQVQEAVGSAHDAFKTYSKLPARTRAKMLLQFDSLLRENLQDISHIVAAETGKPIEEAKGEVEYALTFSWWYLGEVERQNTGQIVPSVSNSFIRFFTITQPIGPVALLTPWNFPVALFVRKVVTALAAGCTIVAKPSPETPLSSLAITKLLEKAGFGNGTVNVVLASNLQTPNIGKILCSDARIKKVSFTGSTRVGRILMEQCAPELKKLTLELGGLGAFIVFEDADLERAAESLVANRFRHAGQTCIAAQRVFVQSSVVDNFTKLIKERMEKLKLGSSFEEGVNIGPLETKRGQEKALEHIRDASEKGAATMTFDSGKVPAKGFYVQPTLLLGCHKEMLVFQEETFAPVLALSTFETEAEAIEKANDTVMGLTSYVFTKDASRLWRCYEEIKAGNVGLNTGNTTSAEIPFGGIDQSGYGKEAGIGAGISEYQITKSATMML